MEAGVQNAKGGVVRASDDDDLTVRQNRFVQPDEKPVLCNPSSLSDLMLPDRLISRSEMNRGDFGWSQVVFS